MYPKLFATTVAVALAASSLHGAAPATHRAHLSADLATILASGPASGRGHVRVIVHGDAAAIAARHGLSLARRLADGGVLDVTPAELNRLAADPGVDHLSGDMPVRAFTSVQNQSTGADQVWAGKPGLLGFGAIPGVTGKGIVVAVVDSGISPHAALTGKVLANVSLVTGDPSVSDAFGHGTHLAGIIAGNGGPAAKVTPLYTGGVAPGAELVNVRVLGADGSGLTSDVIAGIDWVIAHKAQYNIRVINLSLGHPVTEPSATDPLDEEVSKAVSAGLIVVASAGNAGKTADGTPILGGITSPGNSPYAVTVGALNTHNTVSRADDTVDTYSSRGPTRFDLAVKPDVAAPGNKIVSLEAADCYLTTNYSFLHVAGTGSNAYMMLSGTSMAAAMVSGDAALMLQAQPGLSAAQFKLALQTGATYMTDGGLNGAGAGSVNFWNTRQSQANGLTSLTTSLVGGVTSTASGAAYWDAGTMSSRLYSGVGVRLLSLVTSSLAWLNPSLLNWGDLNLVGLLNPLQLVPANNLIWGQVASWTDVSRANQILWGDTIYDSQGQQILWGDSSTTDDNQILWGDAAAASDPW